MVETPTTRTSLLLRLRDADDREAWARFVDLYGPVVYTFARGRGLQDADAADLTQTVMMQVARAIGRFVYEPERGSFRGWLFTIAANEIQKFWRGPPGVQGTGDTAIQRLLEAHAAVPEDPLHSWDEAWERQVFAWAADQVRRACEEQTWQAFWQTAVLDRPATVVAAELGMSPAAVYLAKSRIIARLRKVIQQSQED